MAVGTGFVLGIFSSYLIIVYDPIINALLGAFLALIIYQVVSFSRFFGKRRGEFEYEYRNDLVEKYIKKMVLKTFGILAYINFIQDGFNEISSTQEDICKRLIKNEGIKSSSSNLFFIYLKMSNLSMKLNNFKKEKEMILSAIHLKPNDLIANYRLAICHEMEGSAENAIKHYNLATNDPFLRSNQLRKFILSQVERIKLKGPMNRPPVLGAKYLT